MENTQLVSGGAGIQAQGSWARGCAASKGSAGSPAYSLLASCMFPGKCFDLRVSLSSSVEGR